MNGKKAKPQAGNRSAGLKNSSPATGTSEPDTHNESRCAAPAANQSQAPSKPLWKTPPFWQAFFAGCLVLNAAFTLYFLNGQYEIANNNLTIGQNAQRGWLLFQGASLLRPLAVGQPIQAQYTFKNTGKTPALGIWAGANFYIWKGEGEPEPLVYFDPQFPRRDIGADEPWIGEANRTDESTHRIVPLSLDEWRDLLPVTGNIPAKRVLFLIGAVQYVDVFQIPVNPSTVPHYSNFCAQFLMDASGGGMFVPSRCHIQIR